MRGSSGKRDSDTANAHTYSPVGHPHRASIAFFAFFLTFYWGRLAHAPGGACGAPIPQIAVGARFYVAASAAFSVLVASGFAHVALVMWACHRLVARDAATPAANMP